MFKAATTSDMPQIISLWKEAFKDEEDFINFAINNFAKLENIYIDEADNAVNAMLCAVPVSLNDSRGVYIYAVTTRENMRGKGIMQSLLAYVHDLKATEGYTFACLVPSNEKLFTYYAKLGYEKFSSIRTVKKQIQRSIWAQAEFDTVTARTLDALRQKFIGKDYIRHTAFGYGAVMQYLYSYGASTALTENAYCIYFKEKDTLKFTELFADTENDAIRLMQAVRERTSCENAVISLGSASELFIGEGVNIPYGMIKYFNSGNAIYEPYMNLMMD